MGIYYHVTPAKNLNRILKEGLLVGGSPGLEQTWKEWYNMKEEEFNPMWPEKPIAKGIVWVEEGPEEAMYYTHYPSTHIKDWYLLTLDLPDEWVIPERFGEMVKRNIPPSHIISYKRVKAQED